jgi:glycosyltransferase involved in cell wall biosynthesis
MYQPELSIAVVIPTHNRAKLLQRALESVIRQTSSPEEIIVVDDASTDETQDVAKAYERFGVQCIRRERNGSAGAARNSGVLTARSNVVCFLDDDDEYEGRFVESVRGGIVKCCGLG